MIFFQIMNSLFGRALRMFLGTLLAWYGAQIGGVLGIIMMIVGLIPFLAGLFNLCLIAPLFGYPISGRAMKIKLQEQQDAQSPD